MIARAGGGGGVLGDCCDEGAARYEPEAGAPHRGHGALGLVSSAPQWPHSTSDAIPSSLPVLIACESWISASHPTKKPSGKRSETGSKRTSLQSGATRVWGAFVRKRKPISSVSGSTDFMKPAG